MAKNNNFESDIGTALNDFKTATAPAKKETVKNTGYKEAKIKIKNSDCYLRLDLMPAGVNLKEYVNKNKGALSATAFIQNLIKADMERKKPKQTLTRLTLALETLTEEQLKALLAVANEFNAKNSTT